MESAGWGEGADNNGVVVRNGVDVLAYGEWSMACGVCSMV